MTASTTPFVAHMNALESLRSQVSKAIKRPTELDFGVTDCGQHWAAVGVESLPRGSFGQPGTLVSVLMGAGVPGVAAVMGADGSTLATAEDDGGLPMALQIARDAAAIEYAQRAEGSRHAH